MKPLLDQSFWSDPDIEQSKAGVKLAALWLITNSQTSLLGICGASTARFVFETGLPAKALQSALEALPRSFKQFGDAIFVRNYIRHQFGSGEKLMRNNFFVALKSLFISVKDEKLKAFILSEYPEFAEALQRASEGLTKPKDVQEGKGKDRGKESAERKPTSRPASARPTIEQALAYGEEIGMKTDEVQSWFDHFEANGWRVGGKTPMRDWQAALRNGNRMKANFKPRNSKPAPKEAPAKGAYSGEI